MIGRLRSLYDGLVQKQYPFACPRCDHEAMYHGSARALPRVMLHFLLRHPKMCYIIPIPFFSEKAPTVEEFEEAIEESDLQID